MIKIFGLSRKEKKDKEKDAICLFEVSGRNIDMILTHTRDQKITVAKKARPLPDKSFYITSINIIGKLDLTKPIRAYILNRDEPKNLEFANIEKNEDGTDKEVKWNSDRMDLILNNNIFTAMIRGLTLNKMQMFLYGCMGIVIYEVAKAVLGLIILLTVG